MLPDEKPRHAAEPRTAGEILGEEDFGYMFRKTLEVVKAAVRIEDVAAYYTDAKLLGNGRLLARCIAPDHEDRTPSMTVYTETQKFRCYGCGLHGDAVDMEQIAGRHVEAWTAVRALAERYRVELPRRPRRWHEWSNEKGRRHDALTETRTRIYQRRFFRMFREDLAAIEDPAEREEEARQVYQNLYPLARSCAIEREGARG